ncbi:MAG: hypothetical protein EBZ87_00740, partial [Microbacteriaceae bacterium]|nr:hypothetical protein [Microbacteriaceae bacterium]
MFKSKRVSLLTIFALLLPSSAGLATLGASAANADDLSSNTDLVSVTFAGTLNAIPGTSTSPADPDPVDYIAIPAGTTQVTVQAVPAEPAATIGYSGNTGLVPGYNAVNIAVTAPSGVLKNYKYFLVVAAPADTSLASFKINGTSVVDGASIDLAPYTTSVSVAAVASDAANTTVEVTGASSLVVGENFLTVKVTSLLDSTSTTYRVSLNVPLSDDASSVVTVADEELINGESVEVDWGTTSVAVVVRTTDTNATYVVTGATGLTTGDNLVTVRVTAKDGVSSEETQITVTVLPNTDSSVVSLAVDGVIVADNDVVQVAALTESVVIDVVTKDEDAIVLIEGGEELIAGENDVTIIVTAADGVSSTTYNLTLNVAFNNDTTLAVFNVEGFDVEDADIVDLEPLTSEVSIEVETTDPEASYEIEGGTDLVPGGNDLIVTVTAADSDSTQIYTVVLNVLPNTDASLSTFTVNEEAVEDGSVVELAPFTTQVDVVVETTDPLATVVIDGDSNLVVGENVLTVIVTAADDSTMDYTVTLVVAESDDASLQSASVTYVDAAGDSQTAAIIDGDEVFLPSNTKEVDVEVVPTDGASTFEIEGATDLAVGENTLTITITAPDAVATEVITVTLWVAVGDVTTSSFTANGLEVEDGMIVDLEPGTEEVEVVVETTDPLATFEFDGASGLVLGDTNRLVLTVTSVDGTISATYTVILNVLPYTDAAIASVSVNGIATVEGEVVEVDAGDLDVEVIPANEFATAAVTGSVTNVSGYTTITVTVTAQDGDTTESREIEVLASSELEIVAGSVPTDGTIRVGTYAKLTKDQFAGSKVTYKWTNDGEEISGATAYRYLLTPDDFGHVIRAKVVSTTAGVAKTLISKPVEFEAGIIKKAPTPGVKGKAVVGSTLTAVARTWSTDVELAYQWYADGTAIEGATEETFEITPDLVDAGVSVGVTGTLAAYATVEKVSAELTVKPGIIRFTTKPSISGQALVGKTLEVDPGTLSTEAEVTYVWSRNGEEIDNTEATYELTAEDYLKTISVKVVATAAGYVEAFATVKTRAVKAGTLTEVPTPAISGDAVVGETLTVDLGGDYPEGT